MGDEWAQIREMNYRVHLCPRVGVSYSRAKASNRNGLHQGYITGPTCVDMTQCLIESAESKEAESNES